jgi:DNA-binding MarR family transcriptional regulator
MKSPDPMIPAVAPPEAVGEMIAAWGLPAGTDRYRASAMLIRVAAMVRNGLDAALAREGLSVSRMQILGLLWHHRSLSCSALAKALSVKLATITGLVDTLEAQGHVERQAEATDGRKWKVVLTRKGRTLCSRALPAQARRFRALTEGLSEDQSTDFIAALEVVAANVARLTTS